MKLVCEKKTFLPVWETCEKCTGDSKISSILATVLFTADEEGLMMKATDFKTSISCRIAGVDVREPGEIAIQTKRVSELFHKAGDNFTLTETDGNVTITSGRSRSRFTAYSAQDFPKLPESGTAERFCTVKASDLSKALRMGGIFASAKNEFPEYLGAVFLDLANNDLAIVSTDRRGLAAARITPEEAGEDQSMLLPCKAANNLASILNKLDTDVIIKHDSSQAFFIAQDMEFSIRKMESKFPAWQKIIPANSKTKLRFVTSELLGALERVNIVVRDYNRIVLFGVSESECVCSGSAQEFGEAREVVQAEIIGEAPVRVAFNTRFLIPVLQAVDDSAVTLEINGAVGHGMIRPAAKPDDFLGVIAPAELIGGEAAQVETERESEDKTS